MVSRSPCTANPSADNPLEVSQWAETIDLQFIDEIVRVKRLRTMGEPHGVGLEVARG